MKRLGSARPGFRLPPLLVPGAWVLLVFALAGARGSDWVEAVRRMFLVPSAITDPSLLGAGRALAGHGAALAGLAVLLVALYGAGRPVARLLLPSRGRGTVGVALGLALGVSVGALLNHALGLTGLLFLPLLGVEALAFAVSGTAAAGKLKVRPLVRELRVRAGDWLPAAGTAVLVAAAFWMSRLPDTNFDPLAYHFAAPEHFLRAHRIHAEPWNVTRHISLGCEMIFIVPWALGGIGAAKLVNVGFVVASVLLVHSLGNALRPGSGWWAALWFAGAGLVVGECWEGKNDLACGLLVAGAARCAIEAARGRVGWWMAAAWLLGAAAGIKYTALLFAAGMVSALPLFRTGRGRYRYGPVVLRSAAGILPVGVWMAANFLFLGNPLHPFLSGILPSVSWGPLYERGMHEFTRAVSPAEAGLAGDWLAAVWRVAGDPKTGSVALFALLPFALSGSRGRGRGYLVAALALAYVLWVPTGRVARYLAPAIPLAAAICGAAVFKDRSTMRSFARLRVALAVISVPIGLANAAALTSVSGWKYLLGQATAGDVRLERLTTWEEARRWVNGNIAARARILFTGEERRLWFAPGVVSHSTVSEPVFWRITRDAETTRRVRVRLRQRGITHQLHNFLTSEFRRIFYWAGPGWTDRQLAVYAGFLREYARPIRVPERIDSANGGFYVFEFASRPGSFPAMFLASAEGRLRRSHALMREGRFREARVEAARTLAPAGSVLWTDFVLATLAAREGDHRNALRLLSPGIEAGYVANGNWTYYGAALLKEGRFDEAVAAFRRARTIHGRGRAEARLGGALFARARYRLDRGRFEEALRDLAEAGLLRPDDPGPPRAAALLFERLGHRLQAAASAREALRRAPRDPDLRTLADRLERERLDR